jgi:uncharacterized protein YbbK (DUF523 family)
MATILISACLLGCKVRYNASNLVVIDPYFEKLTTTHQIISFCPEVSAGMSIPRAPAEITGGDGFDVLSGTASVIEKSGTNITEDFIVAARNTLARCQAERVQFAVLAESSPSCGSQKIYGGNFDNTKRAGKGVTTTLLEQNGVRVFSQHQAKELLEILDKGFD